MRSDGHEAELDWKEFPVFCARCSMWRVLFFVIVFLQPVVLGFRSDGVALQFLPSAERQTEQDEKAWARLFRTPLFVFV